MVAILDHRPHDGVIEVDARLTLGELRETLEEGGERLPYVAVDGFAREEDSVGELVLAGAPHPVQGRFGGWSDWILGARIRLAGGHVGFTGSRVVKSVAGYDLHRALVGSGGEFGVFETLVMRTFAKGYVGELPTIAGRAAWITRVLPSHFPDLADHPDVIAADRELAALWWREGSAPVRSEDDRSWPPAEPLAGDAAWFAARLRAALEAP